MLRKSVILVFILLSFAQSVYAIEYRISIEGIQDKALERLFEKQLGAETFQATQVKSAQTTTILHKKIEII